MRQKLTFDQESKMLGKYLHKLLAKSDDYNIYFVFLIKFIYLYKCKTTLKTKVTLELNK